MFWSHRKTAINQSTKKSNHFIVLKKDMHFTTHDHISNIWDGHKKMQMNFQMYPLQEQFNRVTSI